MTRLPHNAAVSTLCRTMALLQSRPARLRDRRPRRAAILFSSTLRLSTQWSVPSLRRRRLEAEARSSPLVRSRDFVSKSRFAFDVALVHAGGIMQWFGQQPQQQPAQPAQPTQPAAGGGGEDFFWDHTPQNDSAGIQQGQQQPPQPPQQPQQQQFQQQQAQYPPDQQALQMAQVSVSSRPPSWAFPVDSADGRLRQRRRNSRRRCGSRTS